MYRQKVPESEKLAPSPFRLFYPHSKYEPSKPLNMREYIQFISIDPAQKNCAISFERRYANGWIVILDMFKFAPTQEENYTEDEVSFTVENTMNNIVNKLKEYEKHFKETHYVIIERQMVENYKSTRVMNYLVSYFVQKLKKFGNNAWIIEIDSKMKGRMLKSPSNINKRGLKAWSVEKAIELLKIRKDKNAIEIIESEKKKDDLADVICQVEAFCIYMGLGKTRKPKKGIEKPKILRNKKE